ncbi:MAG: hypothetical protein QW261_11005 [Candidatus Jordarchaeaceae archaeon]
MRGLKFEIELPTELPSILDNVSLGPLHLFDFLVLALIVFFGVGLWIVGPPLVYDDFYHMAVAQQIYRLGFVPTWDFWEFAPVGRPHLYPPLLHVLMALTMKVSGGNVLLSVKLVKVLTYPLLVLSLWWTTRKFVGFKAAFYTFTCYIAVLTTLTDCYETSPVSLVLIFSLILFWFFTQKKMVTSITLLSLALWMHISMPILIIIVLGAFSIVRREEGYLPFFVKVLGASLLVYSPWLVHLLANFDWLSSVGTPLGLHIPLLAWVLGAPGLLYSLKYYKNNSFIFAILALVLIPMFISYGHRFWIYILIPLSFYTGVTVSRFIGSKHGKWRKTQAIIILILGLSAVTITPAIGESLEVFIYSPNTPPYLEPSAFSYLAFWPTLYRGLTPINFDPTGNIDPVGNTFFYYLASLWIELFASPQQPICVLGGRAGVDSVAITAFSGRPTTNGMWLEVMNPLIPIFLEYYYTNNGTIYIIGPPFTSPPPTVPTTMVAQFGPVKIFVRN